MTFYLQWQSLAWSFIHSKNHRYDLCFAVTVIGMNFALCESHWHGLCFAKTVTEMDSLCCNIYMALPLLCCNNHWHELCLTKTVTGCQWHQLSFARQRLCFAATFIGMNFALLKQSLALTETINGMNFIWQSLAQANEMCQWLTRSLWHISGSATGVTLCFFLGDLTQNRSYTVKNTIITIAS